MSMSSFNQLPQMFIYDGKTGELVSSLGGDKAHNGGIYAVSEGFFFFYCKPG